MSKSELEALKEASKAVVASRCGIGLETALDRVKREMPRILSAINKMKRETPPKGEFARIEKRRLAFKKSLEEVLTECGNLAGEDADFDALLDEPSPTTFLGSLIALAKPEENIDELLFQLRKPLKELLALVKRCGSRRPGRLHNYAEERCLRHLSKIWREITDKPPGYSRNPKRKGGTPYMRFARVWFELAKITLSPSALRNVITKSRPPAT
jgi:hypothetical protein